MRLWDVETGKHIRTLTGHTALVTSVAFSPDGNTIAGGSYDKTVRLWDVNTGTNTHTLTGHAALVTSVAFSPDGKTLASGSSDKTVRLWNVETETYTHMFKHTGRVTSVAFSPDRKTLASGGYDKTVRLWDVHTHTNIHTLTGHTGGVKSVAFSPDGHTLASGSSDGTVRLWELPPTHVTLTPNPVVLPPIGKQFTISANIVGGENVAGYQVSLRFDTTALRYVESTKADYLPSSFFAPPVVSWNKITLAATSLAGLGNGDGTLATVTFEVLALKASVVEVFDVILSNGKGEHLFSSPYGTKVTTGGSPKPDLVVKVVNDTLHEIDINKKEENDLRFNLKVRVRNQGTGPSHETRLRYYQSANDKVSSSDTEIPDRSNESYVVPPLNPGETSEISREFIRVPESVGDHYYKVYVDRVPNESNTDNNWSDLVKVLVYGDKGLKLPQNLISNVAFGRDSTYFVVNAEFPQSYIPLNDFIYGNCVVTFDILGVPTDPVSVDDPKNSWRFDNPGYFMYPLQTPRARLAEIKAESDVDTHITMTTSAIGVVTGVGIGATLGSVIPVLGTGLGALAGRAIGGVTGYFVGVGLRAALEEGGDVIDEEIVLASTADPTLIFWPPR